MIRPRLIKRAVALAAALLLPLGALLLDPPRGSTHDPITTNVRFNKEVIRILQRHCLSCHSEGGIKSDIPLTNYDQARPWAKAIKEEVLEKRMPPYQTVKGYGAFQHDYQLPQREIDLLISWVEGGAPKGDEKDLPREIAPVLGEPDALLQPESETKVAADDDVVRCFILPTRLTADRYLQAIDFRPGAGAAVHRASFALLAPAKARVIGAATEKNDACASGEGAAEELGGWVPGQVTTRLPPGVGWLLPAGSRLLVRIHYRGAGEAAIDRSALALYFAREGFSQSVHRVTISAPPVALPAGASAHRVKASYVVATDTSAIAVRPRHDPFARSVEVTAHRPDRAAEVLIWIKNRRTDWEPVYYFRKPVVLPKGTRVEVTSYFDNSDGNLRNPDDPPRPVSLKPALCELVLTTASRVK